MRSDDLIGLLRELDGAMRTVAPPAGHEARLRARLTGSTKRKDRSRPAVLVLCAAAGALSVWLGWSASKEPDASLPPSPVPSASSRAIGEPGPIPSGSATAPPRWAPRRVPMLPVLPPRSSSSPVPERGPLSLPVAPRDERAWDDVPESHPDRTAARDMAAPPAQAPRGSAASPAARPQTPALRDVAAAGPEGRSSGLGSMGAVASEGHRGSVPVASPAHESGSTATVYPVNPGNPGSPGSPANAGSGGSRWPLLKTDVLPGACGANEVDAGGKCMFGDDLADQAAMLCKSMGFGPGMIVSSSECDGMGPGAKLVHCCAPVSPQKCSGTLVGDPATCVDAGTLKQMSADACAAMGLDIKELYTTDDCPDGKSTQAKVMCCGPDAGAPGEPPLPAGVVGDGATCIADEKLEDEAADLCDEQGFVVIAFGGAEDCGPGVSRIAKYACGK